MGTTSADRNPQPNSLETETTESPFFRLLPHKSKLKLFIYINYSSIFLP